MTFTQSTADAKSKESLFKSEGGEAGLFFLFFFGEEIFKLHVIIFHNEYQIGDVDLFLATVSSC